MRAHILRIAFALEQVNRADPRRVDQPLAEVAAEARRVIARDADVLVEMEHLDVAPGHVGQRHERGEELEL